MSTYAVAASQDMPPSALLAALNRAQERIQGLEQENSQLRQEIRWIDKLLAVPASIMSPSHKVTLRAAVKAYQQGTPDENGLVQIESWKLCKTVGQSRQTFLDNLTYCAENLGILTKKRERLVDSNTNDYTTNLYIGVTPLLARPHEYKVATPRNHGGKRQLCPHCHSDRLQRKVTITCMSCGSILDEKISLVNQGSHLDVSPESQMDHSTHEHTPVDQEPTPDTHVNLTSIKTNVLERQRDASDSPQQEPTTPPVGEAVNGIGNTDTQPQEASPTEFSAFKAGYSSCEEQSQSPFQTANSSHHHEQHQAHPGLCTTDALGQAEVLTHAAKLLVEIAGPEAVHIEMSPRGPQKYYDVKGAITERDTRAHLHGWKTKGAYLRHPGGMTRALCYDADTPHDWQTLQTAARLLTYGDFCPILEPSPVREDGHTGGGHLWIIFTDLVKATWAHQRAWQYAPMLREIKEAWPGPSHQKVRLPGGKYVKLGFSQWCSLSDSYGKPLATDGQGAARILLDYQTPADIIPEYPEPEDVAQQMSRDVGHQAHTCSAKNGTPSCDEMQPRVDQYWQDKYGRYLWFRFTPAQLAAWYNERNQVADILPPEKNGMGLASWRGEHTASVGLREDGWVDFGASARRNDGKQDGGDALELTVRVNDEPKPDVMRAAARQLVSEAREAMESAAHQSEQPPQWVQAFMSPAGWERYHQLRQEAGYPDEAPTAIPEPVLHTRGVGGFYAPDSDTPASHTHTGQGQRPLRESVQTASADVACTHDTQEAFAAEIGATIGEPCKRCSCTISLGSIICATGASLVQLHLAG